jgi:hypothetical protein
MNISFLPLRSLLSIALTLLFAISIAFLAPLPIAMGAATQSFKSAPAFATADRFTTTIDRECKNSHRFNSGKLG